MLTNLESFKITAVSAFAIEDVNAVVGLLEANPLLQKMALNVVGEREGTGDLVQVVRTAGRLTNVKEFQLYFHTTRYVGGPLERGFPSLEKLSAQCHSQRLDDLLSCISSPNVHTMELEITGTGVVLSHALRVAHFAAHLKRVGRLQDIIPDWLKSHVLPVGRAYC